MSETERLAQARGRTHPWKRWGPYLSERAWGTVREDYSPDGDAWGYFPYDRARSRAYRWNEDGLAGLCDRRQILCFALALWNGRDPHLKERLFGLTGPQGNHGEDVKEYYFYLDSTPTHSYMKWLYKYPHAVFPYERLLDEGRRRGKRDPEFELLDTGIFDEDRYWDVVVEYAKAGPEDILIAISATNRGPEPALIHLLPHVWFRNTWAWGREDAARPALRAAGPGRVAIDHPAYGPFELACEGDPDLLFCDNDTDARRLFGAPNPGPFVKSGIGDRVVLGDAGAVNPEREGTKCAAWRRLDLAPGEGATFRLRLRKVDPGAGPLPAAEGSEGLRRSSAARMQAGACPGGGAIHDRPAFEDFEAVFVARRQEADEFYAAIVGTDPARSQVGRQALAGMLWSKQFYHYVVDHWLQGDPAAPPPPAARRSGRNARWGHLWNQDVISMPDKWEYPWYAAWDLAFHCVTLALVDPDFAKEQLLLLLREWYQHPSGQLPAYEWTFSDVNPPVHAWAALRVYEIERRIAGKGDRAFLERVFHKLLLNFTWWVNRKDSEGNNIFEGGFLGLDNIGVFDRSATLPTGGSLEQSDGSSWMAMYCLNLLAIALELARENAAYEDVASKFFEHYVRIADAMNDVGADGVSLWDERDGFYYDVLHLPDGRDHHVKIRSMVGLVPLFAVLRLGGADLARMPGFSGRLQWFVDNVPDLVDNAGTVRDGERLLSLVRPERLARVLRFLLDEAEFLAPHGVRSLSRCHLGEPYVLRVAGQEYRVDYDPGESSTGMFGGNSNWRGPVWFPVNFLLIEALQEFGAFLGDSFRAECPAGSGRFLTLPEVAAEIAGRLCAIFLPGADGSRPCHGATGKFREPGWAEHLLFHEYFHGDNGAGLGAGHQTGWTGLVANLLAAGAWPSGARITP